MNQFSTLILVFVSVCSLTACSSCGAPKAKAIDSEVAEALKSAPVTEPDEEGEGDASAETPGGFDHSSYQALLVKHVRFSDGRVDYAGFKADEEKLDGYLETLVDADLKSLSRDDQLALLLNAYNGFTLKLILENYGEIDSIRDLENPWKSKRWKLAGDTLSLDDIEHGLIRPIFKDPRIHFAVNCASIGCPPLADFAFDGAELDDQLDLVTAKALKNARYAKVEGGKLHLTKIMDWYGEDFTKDGWAPTAESLPAWVATRSTDEVRAYVEKGDPEVTFLDYDWSLNDVE